MESSADSPNPSYGSSDSTSPGRRNSWSGRVVSEPGTPQRFGSAISELFDPPWADQCVLSFDGGGFRGYSSLIIIRRLMKKVQEIETEKVPEHSRHRHSSYSPECYVPCVNNSTQKPETNSSNGSGSSSNGGNSNSTCDECCRFLPCHYFDYIGGTSTGGLISIMLGRLRMSIDSCIREYQTLARHIFGHPRWASVRGPIPWLQDKYDGDRIQKAVENVIKRRMAQPQRQVGAGNFNSPLGLCRTVVFAYAEKISNDVTDYGTSDDNVRRPDVESSLPYLFRSYDHWGSEPPSPMELNPGTAHSIPIWQAARATTAAPMYFDTIKISNRKFGDGGFGTNNPAQRMFFEVCQMNGNDPKCIKLLLSIGTGEVAVSRFENGVFRKYLQYINAARKLASDSAETHTTMDGIKQQWDVPYYRFNVPENFGLGKIKLDEYEVDTLTRIENDTERYCNEIEGDLKKVATILVDSRRARAVSALWPLVSTGKQYRCTVKRCRRAQELLQCRDDIRFHLEGHKLKESEVNKHIERGTCPRHSGKKENAPGS